MPTRDIPRLRIGEDGRVYDLDEMQRLFKNSRKQKEKEIIDLSPMLSQGIVNKGWAPALSLNPELRKVRQGKERS